MNICFGSRMIGPKQLNRYIASTIKVMKSTGIVSGDRVALVDVNTIEYVVLVLCLWHMGVIVCPVNPHWPLNSAKEYAHKISAKHFFNHEEIKRMVAFDARLQLNASDVLPVFNPSHEAAIIATSGSNGLPKPAMLTFGNFLANARGSKEIIPFSSDDGWLLTLPLYHVSGLSIIIRCLEADATLIVPVRDHLIDDIKQDKVTHISLVPTQLYRFFQDPTHTEMLRHLKAILIGGSAISLSLLDQALNEKLPVFISYGLTETASQVATGRVGRGQSTCVKVLPFREVSISPDNEILVRGEVLFKGYIQGQHIHLPLTHGWFCTGDIGSLNDEGCLSVLGRRDNMFISAGENIHPEEIEKILLRIKAIHQAVVVPKVDSELMFKPVAFVDMDVSINREKLQKICRESLPSLKIPVEFYSWPKEQDALKLNRRILIKLAENL